MNERTAMTKATYKEAYTTQQTSCCCTHNSIWTCGTQQTKCLTTPSYPYPTLRSSSNRRQVTDQIDKTATEDLEVTHTPPTSPRPPIGFQGSKMVILLQLDNLTLNLLTSRPIFCFPSTVIRNLLLLLFLGAATETAVVEAVTEVAAVIVEAVTEVTIVIVVTTVSMEAILATTATTPAIVPPVLYYNPFQRWPSSIMIWIMCWRSFAITK